MYKILFFFTFKILYVREYIIKSCIFNFKKKSTNKGKKLVLFVPRFVTRGRDEHLRERKSTIIIRRQI
jgi:hypothetical protein